MQNAPHESDAGESGTRRQKCYCVIVRGGSPWWQTLVSAVVTQSDGSEHKWASEALDPGQDYLVEWADDWMSCPAATVSHGERGWDCPGGLWVWPSSFSHPLTPDCPTPVQRQTNHRAGFPHQLVEFVGISPVLMPQPQHTAAMKTPRLSQRETNAGYTF